MILGCLSCMFFLGVPHFDWNMRHEATWKWGETLPGATCWIHVPLNPQSILGIEPAIPFSFSNGHGKQHPAMIMVCWQFWCSCFDFHQFPSDPQSRKGTCCTSLTSHLETCPCWGTFFQDTHCGSTAGAWIFHRCSVGEMCLKRKGAMMTTVDLSNWSLNIVQRLILKYDCKWKICMCMHVTL